MSRKEIIAVAVVLLVLAQVVGFCYVPGSDIVLLLAFGWVFFLVRVVPKLSVRWDLVASTGVYVIALAVGSHLFLRWLYREMKRSDSSQALPPAWKWRWTLGGLTVVLLMFAAGTAAVGIAHQTTWLARSPEPLYRSRSHIASRMKCASNLRQIGQGLELYAIDHGGHYPDDLRSLPLHVDLEVRQLLCPESADALDLGPTTQEAFRRVSQYGLFPYVYFGKGLTAPVDPTRVVAVELLENHGGDGINVLYGDGRARWLERPEAERVLLELGFTREAAAPAGR